ncbi:hypothetical protein ACG7TL_009101 [Trametes sanguinea]
MADRVLLILQDGRAIVGVMAGYDQKSNVVLSDSKERVYSMDEGVEEIPLGLYLVKGDQMCVPLSFSLGISRPFSTAPIRLPLMLPYADANVNRVLIGELDEAADKAVDLSTIRAEPLPPIPISSVASLTTLPAALRIRRSHSARPPDVHDAVLWRWREIWVGAPRVTGGYPLLLLCSSDEDMRQPSVPWFRGRLSSLARSPTDSRQFLYSNRPSGERCALDPAFSVSPLNTAVAAIDFLMVLAVAIWRGSMGRGRMHKTRRTSGPPASPSCPLQRRRRSAKMVLSNDLAALVGFASEAVLWGINSVLFIASLVLLLRRAPSRGLNVPILVLGCALFASCTAHFALEFSHYVTTLRDIGVAGFANETKVLVGADILISLSDLLGDFVLIYRCWIVWGPCIAEVVHLVLTIDPNAPVAPPAIVPLGLAGYALPLATNILTTALIVARLWHTARAAEARCRGRMAGTVRVAKAAVAIIVESGALYLAAQLVLVVLFALEHPAQAVVAVMAVQIYGIAPTLIVLRVALGISSDYTTRSAPEGAAAAHGPGPAHVSFDMEDARSGQLSLPPLTRPGAPFPYPFMSGGTHSYGETEESAPTLRVDAEYLEMKAFGYDSDGLAMAV